MTIVSREISACGNVVNSEGVFHISIGFFYFCRSATVDQIAAASRAMYHPTTYNITTGVYYPKFPLTYLWDYLDICKYGGYNENR